MRIIARQVALAVAALLLLVPPPAGAATQESKSIVAHANGSGTLKVGDEKFQITSVVIKLFEDGKAEINLISDLTIFVSGTWTRDESAPNAIKLKINAGATGGGIDAAGDLFLRDATSAGEPRTIDRVSLSGTSKTTHRNISLSFKAA
jgi:hypothetical protein